MIANYLLINHVRRQQYQQQQIISSSSSGTSGAATSTTSSSNPLMTDDETGPASLFKLWPFTGEINHVKLARCDSITGMYDYRFLFSLLRFDDSLRVIAL
jgi:hypothetical protein